MTQYKIYTKGNYIVIVNIQKNEYFYGIRKEVHIDKSNLDKEVYRAFNVKDFDDSIVLQIPNILKEDNSPYTEAEFDTFYTENTGNFNGGGTAPILTEDLFKAFTDSIGDKTTPITTDGLVITDSEDSDKAKILLFENLWDNFISPLVQGLPTFFDSLYLGSITPSSTPTGTGESFWITTEAGTYTNFGGVIVSPNSLAVISRNSVGVFSISQTAINLSSYVNYSDFVAGKNLFDKSTVTSGFYLDSLTGQPVADISFIISDFIKVSPSTNYFINSPNGILFYRADKTYINFAVTQNFTTPSDCAYVRFSLTNALINTIQLETGNVETIYEPFEYTLNKLFANSTLDRWRGKNVNFIGDSITAGLFVGTALAYPANVSKILHLKQANNFGVSASCISKYVGKTDSLLERLTSLNNGADLNVIFGGANDYRTGIPIGTIASTNEFEFYGALKALVSGILTQAPTARLCFITPFVDNETVFNIDYVNLAGHKLVDYINAIKAVCERYSIPVYDNYSKSGINAITQATYTSDGLHPNALGHQYLAKQFSNFINQL
jgi:lysophospholipase L1-like esterase